VVRADNFQFARYPLLDVRFGRELNIGVLARASTDQPPQTHISEECMPDIRKETDGLGVVEVPADKPCAQIQRSVELTARRTVEK
jgi:hypothetical protein